MQKLTDKIKYSITESGAELYAGHWPNGKWKKVDSCHMSVIDFF